MSDLLQRVLDDLDALNESAALVLGRPRSPTPGQWILLWDKRTETPCGTWHRVIAPGRLACVAAGAADPHVFAIGSRWFTLQRTDEQPWDPCLPCLES